ncbi:restriction endonuclease subunit S [Vibrio cholerae]|nr:restriction endonuclease subunit S [Vibrio cholerae]EJL9326389.1 restriction endonuclease subunit S [Vibrio cholerae]ELL7182158.1 restriction endonuclease subunit S [Vibrio cholerae]ELY5214390.1 restriction endonuclease subunit S [Vibrio cholerae]HDZ9140857.1 restriction endonuclease subunit S [Vibrio cholerae]
MSNALKLGDVAVVKGGSGFPEKYQGGSHGLPFIKVSDMNLPGNQRYIWKSNNYLNTTVYNLLKPTVFPRDTVVFAKVGAAVYLNKRRILTEDTAIDNNLMGVTATAIEPLFLYYLLQSIDLAEWVQPGALPSINQTIIEALPIPITDRKQQRYISEVLNALDNQIEATQALIDKYTAIKQGMMADLFSRGIDPETKALRPTFEEAPELYHKTPLGMLPKGWGVKTLGEISEKITSGSRDWAKFYSSEGDLFVRISNLTREHVNFRWDSVKYVNIGGGSEGERTQLQPGDILVSITADLGIVGVVPENMGRAYINQHTALIRLSTDGENARFIGNYLSSRCGQDQFEKNNDSGAKAGINLPTIASLRCPIPEGKEQLLIASKIDALDEVIADLKREKSKSLSLKQGLMQDLLTGKVPVPA